MQRVRIRTLYQQDLGEFVPGGRYLSSWTLFYFLSLKQDSKGFLDLLVLL